VLVVSDGVEGDTCRRSWYSKRNDNLGIPNLDDPSLARFDMARRPEIINQLKASTRSDPELMVEERCAITTRVSHIFVRIGHFDLFARRIDELLERAGGDDDENEVDDMDETSEGAPISSASSRTMTFGLPLITNDGKLKQKKKKIAKTSTWCVSRVETELMEGSMVCIARMVAGWIQMGFVQGNFNADICLVGGRTMDYNPFDFVDAYHPLTAKWTRSGEHFGFMNQPSAGYANYAVLVKSLMPIINVKRNAMLEKAQLGFSEAVDKAMRSKMGLVGDHLLNAMDELWKEMEPLLRLSRGNWNLFWRQLTYVAAKYSPAMFNPDDLPPDYDGMMTFLLGGGPTYPFYNPLTGYSIRHATDEQRTSRKAMSRRQKRSRDYQILNICSVNGC